VVYESFVLLLPTEVTAEVLFRHRQNFVNSITHKPLHLS